MLYCRSYRSEAGCKAGDDPPFQVRPGICEEKCWKTVPFSWSYNSIPVFHAVFSHTCRCSIQKFNTRHHHAGIPTWWHAKSEMSTIGHLKIWLVLLSGLAVISFWLITKTDFWLVQYKWILNDRVLPGSRVSFVYHNLSKTKIIF